MQDFFHPPYQNRIPRIPIINNPEISFDHNHMCHGQNMVGPWAQASPQRGRWGGPLLIGSCCLRKALLVKCFGMRFFRHVYASVTTMIPAFCPACWCCRWFLPSYFCLVVLTLIMFWCARSSWTWALSNIDVAWHHCFFFKPWMWLRCIGVVPFELLSPWFAFGLLRLVSVLTSRWKGWSSAHTWVPPMWWNWSQTCDRAVLWWILCMVSCDKVFAWLESFIDDNVYLGHRCSMCTCLPLDSWCHLDRPLPLAWARACSSLPRL